MDAKCFQRDLSFDIELEGIDPGRLALDACESRQCPGAAIAVSKPGAIRCWCAGELGAMDPRPVSEHTRFPVGCISEVLLALVGSELATIGAFDWDEPLGSYVHEARALPSDHRKSLTAWHLLANTSGLDYSAHPHRTASLSSLFRSGFFFSPGQFYSRSVFNIRLLSLVLDAISPGCVATFVGSHLGGRTPDIYSADTTGHIAGPEGIRPIPRPDALASAEFLALTVGQIAQCGQLFMDTVLGYREAVGREGQTSRFREQFIYAIDGHLAPQYPPLYVLLGGTYSCSGHFPGHVVQLVVAPGSRLSLALASNSDSIRLMSKLLQSTNLWRNSTLASNTNVSIERAVYRCIDPSRIGGRYVGQHGETLDVTREGSDLILTGVITHGFPPIAYEKAVLRQFGSAFVPTHAMPTAQVQVSFLSPTSSGSIPSWMRVQHEVFRRTTAY